MPYNYNYYRRKRIQSERELQMAQMLQTVLVEDTGINVGGQSTAGPVPIPLPAGVYNRARWSAASGIDESGSTLTWTDSINGYTLTANNASVTYNDAYVNLNDKPAVRFAGGYMEGAFSLYTGSSFDYTIIIVSQGFNNSGSSGGGLIESWATNATGGGSVANPLIEARKVGTGKMEVSGFNPTVGTGFNLYKGATWDFMDGSNTQKEIGAFTFDGTSPTTSNKGNFYTWDNTGTIDQKLENQSMAAGYGTQAGTPKTRLMAKYGGASNILNAFIAEFIYVERKLSFTELEAVVEVLTSHYGF